MLARLAKLADTSRSLSRAVEKRAGLLGGAARLALKHPGKTLAAGMTGTAAVVGGRGKYREFKTGFDPVVQQQMLGMPPTP